MRLVANVRNLGFTHALNQGILAARPDSDVVVLNNDAMVTPGWVEALQEVVQAFPDAGIVVPRQVLLPGTATMTVHVPGAHAGHELDVNLSDHHGNVLDPEAALDRGFVELSFAPFFCAYLTRECVRRVGLLDATNGRHYGSDRLYCDFARDQGLRVLYTPHAKVYHFLQRSTADLLAQRPGDYARIFAQNRWEEGEQPDLPVALVSEERPGATCVVGPTSSLPAAGTGEARGRHLDTTRREPLERLARELIDLEGVALDDGTQFPNHAEPPGTTAERRAVRIEGRDWPARALTMAGLVRLGQLMEAIETVVAEGIPGDVVEAGVWRGGASILARALLRTLSVTDRVVWCADSFAGLPPPDPTRHPADAGDAHHKVEYLKAGLPEVRASFARFGELDDQVRFLPGWFADTLPDAPIGQVAVLRLDADMYGSTTDALRHLYPRMAPGGFVIVDDYGAVAGCQRSVDDFRATHDITAPLQFIDWTGRFWRVPTRFTSTERHLLLELSGAEPDNALDLWPGHQRPDSGRRCEEARRCLALGDRDGALALASMVLAEEPNSLEAHLVLAAVELPGPDYVSVLRDVHAALVPHTYLELGVFKGDSLSVAASNCRAIGVDPRPLLEGSPPEHVRLFHTTSGRFFADGDARALARRGGRPSFHRRSP